MSLPGIDRIDGGRDPALRPGARSRHTGRRRPARGQEGRSFSAVNRPGDARPRISAPLHSMMLSCVSMRRPSRACRRRASLHGSAARAADGRSTITSVVIVSSERRILGSVMRFICGQRLAGPHKFDIGILTGDVVAHRAFRDHHDLLRPLLATYPIIAAVEPAKSALCDPSGGHSGWASTITGIAFAIGADVGGAEAAHALRNGLPGG